LIYTCFEQGGTLSQDSGKPQEDFLKIFEKDLKENSPEIFKSEQKYSEEDKKRASAIDIKLNNGLKTEINTTLDFLSRANIQGMESISFTEDCKLEGVPEGKEEWLQSVMESYDAINSLVAQQVISGQEFYEFIDSIEDEESLKKWETDVRVLFAKQIGVLKRLGEMGSFDSSEAIKKAGDDSFRDSIINIYKERIVHEVREKQRIGLFNEQEAEQFEDYYSNQGLLIDCIPVDVSDSESVIAFSATRPIFDRLEMYRIFEELKSLNVISSEDLDNFLEELKAGVLSEKNSNILFQSERVRYGRSKGIIVEGREYDTAMRLIPALFNESDNIAQDDLKEIVRKEEAISEGMPKEITQSDRLENVKGLLLTVINVWEDTLGWDLSQEFDELLNTNNAVKFNKMRGFLIELHRTFIIDKCSIEQKKIIYLEKIRKFVNTREFKG
jgi:hypothetical protein